MKRTFGHSRQLFGCALLAWATLASMSLAVSLAESNELVAAHTETRQVDVQQLIEQLGNDQYILRQQAETQLLDRGAEAFAALQRAQQHADLEIATRAKYILEQVTIEWSRSTDSPKVKSIMARYGELSSQAKLTKLVQLTLLKNYAGLGALCRIARFDSSAKVSRLAAIEILKNGFVAAERAPAVIAVLADEAGPAQNGPMPWIQLYVEQLKAPTTIDPRWLAMLDAEIVAFDNEVDRYQRETTRSLVLCHRKLCDQLSDAEALLASLQRSMQLDLAAGVDLPLSVSSVLKWLLDHEQWEALSLVEDRYAETIRSERLPLYLLAFAQERQERAERAESLAKQAFELALVEEFSDEEDRRAALVDDAKTRRMVADQIADLGRHDWARREWEYVIATLPATDRDSLTARLMLSMFYLNDREQHDKAAKLLNESIEAINNEPAIRSLYRDDVRLRRQLEMFRSHYHYSRACHLESLQDYEQQRQQLDIAHRLDRENADILIAMYHLKEADEDYREESLQKISRALKRLEAIIRKVPSSANSYNHWAWLVSNTEGDFAKAVKYSKQSLQLEPETPSYLDTLGRCYYAVGELEKAVEVQRQAVDGYPHLAVMQRQLESFESELKKRAANAN